MAPPLLLLQDIALTFGGMPLLEAAGLAVPAGERLCLVGRNGSGKSTLLKIAAGLIEPDRVPRKILQKSAVMTDNDERGPRGFEFRLEPFDRWQIEMIGRLVEKQNIRLGREHAGERGAPRLAARKPRRIFLAA